MRIWPNIVWSTSKMPPFHGNCSKIKTISHKNESQVFTKTPANTAQYWQMFQNQDYFAWKLNSCCRKNAGEYGPILDKAHLECCHFTAKDPESRLFRMKIKVRFHHSLMRIWPNVERNASRLYFAANHTEPRLFRMEMKVRFHYSRIRIWPNVGRNAYSMLPLIALQMIQNQDHFSWKLKYDWTIDLCEHGPIWDEKYLECCHFTAMIQNVPKSRPFRMETKVRFDYLRMRIWTNIG